MPTDLQAVWRSSISLVKLWSIKKIGIQSKSKYEGLRSLVLKLDHFYRVFFADPFSNELLLGLPALNWMTSGRL